MKRQQFEITHNCKVLAVKYAWNAARREIPNLVRAVALAENVIYEKHKEVCKTDGDGKHIAGYQVWANAKTGKVICYEIRKVI